MNSAFVGHIAVRLVDASGWQCVSRITPSACQQPPSHGRRALIVGLSLLTLHPFLPAKADRTGKFSTKLTAKRRYLPRIQAGLEALRGLGLAINDRESSDRWIVEVTDFVAGRADDMKTALALFSTSYFSEGNKIGPTERKLKEVEDELYQAIRELDSAARNGSKSTSRALEAYVRAVSAANEYISVAKLQDVIPMLQPAQ